MNLTGSLERETLVGHVVDGCCTGMLGAGAPRIVDGWLDVGSGGGFPGLILAAVGIRPLVLVEPRAKRASVLELALAAVDRTDVAVRRARVSASGDTLLDGLGPLGGGFGVVSARAVFSPGDWLDIGRGYAGPDGWVLVHLGEDPEELGAARIASCAVPSGTIGAYVSRGTSETHRD